MQYVFSLFRCLPAPCDGYLRAMLWRLVNAVLRKIVCIAYHPMLKQYPKGQQQTASGAAVCLETIPAAHHALAGRESDNTSPTLTMLMNLLTRMFTDRRARTRFNVKCST